MVMRYQKTKELLLEIKSMIKERLSHREIEIRLGLKGDRPIHNLLKRERRREKQLPKKRGRLNQSEHDAALAVKISLCRQETRKTYGYRRVWIWLKIEGFITIPKQYCKL